MTSGLSHPYRIEGACMTNNIRHFLPGYTAGAAASRFQKEYAKCKTNEERRALELAHLRPRPLPKYVGKEVLESAKNPLGQRTVLFAFRSTEEIEIVKRHFRVLQHGGLNVRNSELLIKLLRRWEKKHGKPQEESH